MPPLSRPCLISPSASLALKIPLTLPISESKRLTL
jgi:hypothetical protein